MIGLSPDGPHAPDSHVKVPNELLEVIPPPLNPEEQWNLEEVAEDDTIDVHSRLASKIVLDHKLNGALFALGDIRPWKIL